MSKLLILQTIISFPKELFKLVGESREVDAIFVHFLIEFYVLRMLFNSFDHIFEIRRSHFFHSSTQVRIGESVMNPKVIAEI